MSICASLAGSPWCTAEYPAKHAHIVEGNEPRYRKEASFLLRYDGKIDESSVTKLFLLAASAEELTEFVLGTVMSKVLHFVMKRRMSSRRFKLQKQ